MKCKYCQAELDENSAFCPACGKYNPENISAEEAVSEAEAAPEKPLESAETCSRCEEAAPEEAAEMPEAAASEEEPEIPGDMDPEEEPEMPEEPDAPRPGMSAGKVTLLVAIAVAVAALVAALIFATRQMPSQPEADPAGTTSAATEPAPSEIPDLNVPELTVPADGDPDTVACKGSYTVEDEILLANRDKVIATAGGEELTVGGLQMYYWMSFYEFLDNYGEYLPMFGLDHTQPLDRQVCRMDPDNLGEVTWQQYFLSNALTSWHRYQAMTLEARAAGMKTDPEFQAYLDGLEASLQASAVQYGFKTAEEMLQADVGAGATMEDFKRYQQLTYEGYEFFDQEFGKLDPTAEEVEAYFQAHAADLEQEGITKDSGSFVDVRHILIAPEGGTKNEKGDTVYSDEEWEAARVKAQGILDQWLAEEKTEDSFAALAKENSTDPGSKDKGGLYTGVRKGQMVPEFDAWCFDEARKEGDSGLVKTTFGYHIMYFAGSQPIWETAARTSLLEELSEEIVDAATEKYPMTVTYKDIVISTVDQTKSA